MHDPLCHRTTRSTASCRCMLQARGREPREQRFAHAAKRHTAREQQIPLSLDGEALFRRPCHPFILCVLVQTPYDGYGLPSFYLCNSGEKAAGVDTPFTVAPGLLTGLDRTGKQKADGVGRQRRSEHQVVGDYAMRIIVQASQTKARRPSGRPVTFSSRSWQGHLAFKFSPCIHALQYPTKRLLSSRNKPDAPACTAPQGSSLYPQ